MDQYVTKIHQALPAPMERRAVVITGHTSSADLNLQNFISERTQPRWYHDVIETLA